jgi:outer membrane receptor protein involved in Fe transport
MVTAGGRLSYSELSGDAEDPVTTAFFALNAAASAERSETRLLPSIALSYVATDRLTLFARYQQSFRPGGIAVRREFIQRFDGDRVGTAEAGLRYRGTDVDFTASGAWTDWRNIQADLIDGFGFPITANVGDGQVYSLGFSADIWPADSLKLDLSVYFNHGRVTNQYAVLSEVVAIPGPVAAATAVSPNLDRLPNVANLSGRVGFSYQRPVSDRALLTIDGYGRYVGKSTPGVGPVLGQLQGDYLDTGLEFALGIDSRRITLSLTNLLDSRGNRFALGSPFLVRDQNQITPLQPRTVRLGYEQRF